MNDDEIFESYDPGVMKPCVEKMVVGCEQCLIKDVCDEYEYICSTCHNNPCTCKLS